MIAEITTGTVLKRQTKVTAAMADALRQLVTHGPARRVRRGWCWNSFDGPFIATSTMDALETRGHVVKRHVGTTAVLTASGREAHDELAETRS